MTEASGLDAMQGSGSVEGAWARGDVLYFGPWFGVEGFGFRVQGPGLRVQGLGSGVQGPESAVEGGGLG